MVFENMLNYYNVLISYILSNFLVFISIISIGLYVYLSYSLMRIAKKLKLKSVWLAWIPIAQIGLFFEAGNVSWLWVSLVILIPFPYIGLFSLLALSVASLTSAWKISEKFKFPSWSIFLSLIPVVGFIWIIAWFAIMAWRK